jgi:hypothetical protein
MMISSDQKWSQSMLVPQFWSETTSNADVHFIKASHGHSILAVDIRFFIVTAVELEGVFLRP